MNDTQRLEHLDREAAAAFGALDAEVAEVEIPPFRASDGDGRRWKQSLPVAAAAALVVCGLLGAALLFAGDADESTVAGAPEIGRFVLPEPERFGFERELSWDRPTGLPSDDPSNVTTTVQARLDAEDPWREVVVEHATPGDRLPFDGSVDIGGPAAAYNPGYDPAPALAWIDGDVVRYLLSTDLDRRDLIALATEAVAEGVESGRALPGHEILHSGDFLDVVPHSSPAPDTTGAVYLDHEGRRLTVRTAAGSEDAWRASSVFVSQEVMPTRVHGHDATISVFAPATVRSSSPARTEVAWLTDDGVLVRVTSEEPPSSAEDDDGRTPEPMSVGELLVIVRHLEPR